MRVLLDRTITIARRGRWTPYEVALILEVRDLWIGLYRTGRERLPIAVDGSPARFFRWRWYVCLIPCLALRITWIEED